MRIRAITPIHVTAEELVRRQERYRRLAPAGVTVHLDNLPPGAPRTLETAEDVAASDRLVRAAAAATDPGAFDLVLPDCVLDPGVGDRQAPVPVAGILRLATGLLAGLGLRFGAVTRNAAIGEELVACLKRYGLEEAFAGLRVLDLDFDAISDEGRWHAALDGARVELAATGADAVVNGCSAVELAGGGAGGATVIDPTRLALHLLGVADTSGLP